MDVLLPGMVDTADQVDPLEVDTADLLRVDKQLLPDWGMEEEHYLEKRNQGAHLMGELMEQGYSAVEEGEAETYSFYDRTV